MNNEPVAWLVQYTDRHEFRWSKPEHLFEALACEPLYTHPVSQYKAITNTKIEPTVVSYTHPVKELTDEEIKELAHQHRWNGDVEFARAILKRASEK